MTISIIAALADNGIIGRDNQIPWRLSSDLKRFKALTMGHHLIVGRKTFESIGRVLPGRKMVVITRDASYTAEGVQVVHSLDEALRVADVEAHTFVGGGSEIYAQALHLADRMYLTRVHAEVEGDAVFPEFDEVEWSLVDAEHFEADDKNEFPYSFLTYTRNAGVELHPKLGDEGG
ncbi:MAG TPA: dihydrofolate reductase [Thermoanaerobaculia bacterium]